MRKLTIMAGLLLATCAAPATAQQTYPTAVSGVRVAGVVPLQCDSSGGNCGPTVTLAASLKNTAGTQTAQVSTPQDGAGASNGLFVVAQNQLQAGAVWSNAKKPVAASTVRLLSAAATTNATLIKGSAGDLFQVTGQNIKAAPVYLKLYNKATAPTCGTDTPVMTFYLPASASFNLSWPTSIYFGTGMGLCLTGAAADADTTALVAGDVVALNVLIQ